MHGVCISPFLVDWSQPSVSICFVARCESTIVSSRVGRPSVRCLKPPHKLNGTRQYRPRARSGCTYFFAAHTMPPTPIPKLRKFCLGLENGIILKVLKLYKRNPCLWDTSHKYYHNKAMKNAAWEMLLQTWRKCQPRATMHDVKIKIFHMRTNYTRQRKKVESSAGASINYTPTLWYYKHLNFLSGKKETDSEDSDSDVNDETVYVQLPRGQNTQPTSTDQEEESERDKEESLTTVDASAAAFGRSVGAQLHHLSKMQRCIAEKLISDVIYHAKMEQLNLDTSINVKEAVEHQTAVSIPKAGPSWYDIDLDNGAQESFTSCPLPTDTIDEIARREMEETQSAVNFIKMESDEAENYVFQDYELSEAIDIVKEEIK